MDAERARALLGAARVAHLATADAGARPHLVPICLALEDDVIFSAVDHKPKRTTALRRLANVAENARACVLADHYDDEDWSALWWVRADGRARVLVDDNPERRRALELLAERYRQYREAPPGGPVLALDVERWSGWSAAG